MHGSSSLKFTRCRQETPRLPPQGLGARAHPSDGGVVSTLRVVVPFCARTSWASQAPAQGCGLLYANPPRGSGALAHPQESWRTEPAARGAWGGGRCAGPTEGHRVWPPQLLAQDSSPSWPGSYRCALVGPAASPGQTLPCGCAFTSSSSSVAVSRLMPVCCSASRSVFLCLCPLALDFLGISQLRSSSSLGLLTVTVLFPW